MGGLWEGRREGAWSVSRGCNRGGLEMKQAADGPVVMPWPDWWGKQRVSDGEQGREMSTRALTMVL